MKRAILCEVCRHQECSFNALLHRQTMTCAVRPGVIAEQVDCDKLDLRPLVISGSSRQYQVAK